VRGDGMRWATSSLNGSCHDLGRFRRRRTDRDQAPRRRYDMCILMLDAERKSPGVSRSIAPRPSGDPGCLARGPNRGKASVNSIDFRRRDRSLARGRADAYLAPIRGDMVRAPVEQAISVGTSGEYGYGRRMRSLVQRRAWPHLPLDTSDFGGGSPSGSNGSHDVVCERGTTRTATTLAC
jgi:hypothetical protein